MLIQMRRLGSSNQRRSSACSQRPCGPGLPYHVVNIVSGELNDAAAKKYDLEVRRCRLNR